MSCSHSIMRKKMMRNLNEMKSFIDDMCSKGEENWVRITVENAHLAVGGTVKFNTRLGSIIAIVQSVSNSGKSIRTDYAKNPSLVVAGRKLYLLETTGSSFVEPVVEGKSGLIKGNSIVMLKEWKAFCSNETNWENERFIYPSKLVNENKKLANFRNNCLVGGHKWNDKVNYEANQAEMLSILGPVAYMLLFKKNLFL